ncbi:ribbon-helix-helix domain-containing protein [Methylovirgula sp. 4M-Z18]
MIAGHRTSISLEDVFWDGLKRIAAERKMTVPALVAEIDVARPRVNLSSAIRVYVYGCALRQQDVPER